MTDIRCSCSYKSMMYILLFLMFTPWLIFCEVYKEENHYSYHPLSFVKSFEAMRESITKNDMNADEIEKKECKAAKETYKESSPLIVAAVQLQTLPSPDNSNNIAADADIFMERAISAVKKAVIEKNATLVLLQELFLGPYFCQSQEADMFGLAEDLEESYIIRRMQDLAKSLQVVLPISIFEKKNNMYYNSVVMIDSNGENLGVYRKSHIPDGTGYQEKFYFSPGDTGFKVFETSVGNVGVAICWDQWFPEAARSMALMGADVILYPTAIGTEPQDPTWDSSDHWQRVMQGHAAANMVPVVASNRVGTEILLDDNGNEKQRISFYGRSFITDEFGEIIQEANSEDIMDIIVSEIDVGKNKALRAAWGMFRDRRPELYGVLKTKDGINPVKLS
eukprot:CAMPEP_0178951540 /NCGR_PEP_ID=MMETSP0789-20121207/7286_1 /TAXON_ID=3005 /ORGANISM="Rhizosolenia setigera, Strain CCMP 1694" /LENGTH=392 /DNA_ID=CAMNT_0020632431 /DNA_START=5 /DNA_END=1183 /DNA_ORIENTATION=-